eukprot:14634677-Alexandrium_andersonii.AAC.1
MAPNRKCTTLAACESQKKRVADILRSVHAAEAELEKEQQVTTDLVDIVNALLADPSKIPEAKRLIVSD